MAVKTTRNLDRPAGDASCELIGQVLPPPCLSKRALHSSPTPAPVGSSTKSPERAASSIMRQKGTASPPEPLKQPVRDTNTKKSGDGTSKVRKVADLQTRSDPRIRHGARTERSRTGSNSINHLEQPPSGLNPSAPLGARKRAETSPKRPAEASRQDAGPSTLIESGGRHQKAVIFGVHEHARGIVAPIFPSHTWELVFVGPQDLIHEMNACITKGYHVTVPEETMAGQVRCTSFRIAGYRAYHKADNRVGLAIAEADVVVGTLSESRAMLMPPIVAGLHRRPSTLAPLVVIDCLYRYLQSEDLGTLLYTSCPASLHSRYVVTTAVFDQRVVAGGPGTRLSLRSETSGRFAIKRTAGLTEDTFRLLGVKYVDDLSLDWDLRQMFEIGQAVMAYYFHFTQSVYRVDDAVANQVVDLAIWQVARLLASDHGLGQDQVTRHVKSVQQRLRDGRIQDQYLRYTVLKAGSHAARKLCYTMVPVAGRLRRRGLAPSDWSDDIILTCIEWALKFQNIPGDDQSFPLSNFITNSRVQNILWVLTRDTLPEDSDAVRDAITDKIMRTKYNLPQDNKE